MRIIDRRAEAQVLVTKVEANIRVQNSAQDTVEGNPTNPWSEGVW